MSVLTFARHRDTVYSIYRYGMIDDWCSWCRKLKDAHILVHYLALANNISCLSPAYSTRTRTVKFVMDIIRPLWFVDKRYFTSNNTVLTVLTSSTCTYDNSGGLIDPWAAKKAINISILNF